MLVPAPLDTLLTDIIDIGESQQMTEHLATGIVAVILPLQTEASRFERTYGLRGCRWHMTPQINKATTISSLDQAVDMSGWQVQ